MANTSSEKNWAILIGIDDYSPLNIRSLEGCVKDVDDQERWLTSHHIIPEKSEKILRLTTNGSDTSPTYDNIWAKLNHVKEHAEPGALIFLHYSGHGSRRETRLPLSTEKNGVDEIFLFQRGYLRDFEFGDVIDGLAKARAVFVVLDCCHSGGLDRDGDVGVDDNNSGVRFVNLGTIQLEEHNIDPEILRKAEDTLGTWWDRPRDYTLLAACQQSQKAREGRRGQGTNGQLTYWLLNALDQLYDRVGPFPYQRLHRYIHANMVDNAVEQHPVIMGQCDRALFTTSSLPSHELAFVDKIVENTNRIQLDVGQAHSVYLNATYAIYGRTFDPVLGVENQALAEVTIDNVGGLSSRADMPAGFDMSRVFRGCLARRVFPGSGNTVAIGLRWDGKYNESKEAIESLQRTVGQCQSRKARLILRTERVNDAPTFWVHLINGHYHILDTDSNPIPHVPNVQVDGIRAAKAVHDLLHRREHFLRVERLRNDSSTVDGMFWFKRVGAEGNEVDEPVEDGDVIVLQFQNTSSETLYFCMLNLRPLGGIKQLIPDAGHGVKLVGPKQSSGRIRIKMSMPEELRNRGVTETRSLFKVVVTTRPSFFRMHQSSEFLSANDDREPSEFRDGEVEELEEGNWQTEQIAIVIRR